MKKVLFILALSLVAFKTPEKPPQAKVLTFQFSEEEAIVIVKALAALPYSE